MLASESVGSSYLIKDEKLTPMLIQLLKMEKGDSNLRQNALGALQKFSLHRNPQTVMIEHDMIKWIIETLKSEAETLSDYTFEYVTALLMNLALRTAGKAKCENPDLEILKVLNEYIEHENLQVRTYINGTLYSLLTRPALKEQARALGMPDLLKHLLEHSEEQLARQVRYIIDQLENDQVEECVSDDNEDALECEEDEDYETENEEEIDTDIVNAGIPIGETLLREYLVQPFTPASIPADGSISGLSKGGHTRLSSSNSVSIFQIKFNNFEDRNLPSAMKSRPKIPRTPINEELLGMIRKENEAIIQNSGHIHRNEDANKKKIKQPQQSPQKEQHVVLKQVVPLENPTGSPSMKEEKKLGSPIKATLMPPEAHQEVEGEDEEIPTNVKEEKEEYEEDFAENAKEENKEQKTEVNEEQKKVDQKEENKNGAQNPEELSKTKEFEIAFKTRTKITRTPPGQEKRFKVSNESPYAKYYKEPN